MNIVTSDTMRANDTEIAAVRYAIDSNGDRSSCWVTLDKRMNEDDARFVFESTGKPDVIDVHGPWRHRLVRLLVNKHGGEVSRAIIDERWEL